jgi:hypothetical protein
MTQTPSAVSVGVIQAADSILNNPTSDIGDMILGVPFMRNTYTVMAYGIPDGNGNFNNDTDLDDASSRSQIDPRLGLMGLTNAMIALQEFHTVRVLNQPLTPSSGQTASDTSMGGKKMSVGIEVLIGLVGFFGLCVALFALRWFTKRKWNRAAAAANAAEMRETKDGVGFIRYQLTRRKSRFSFDDPSDVTLRTTRSIESKMKDRIKSEYTVSSGRTQYDGDFDGEFGLHSRAKEESHDFNDFWGSAGLLDGIQGLVV